MDRISLIYKVLSATASEPEKKDLENWLAQRRENEIEFDDVKLLWEASNGSDHSMPKTPSRYGLIKIKAVIQMRLRRRRQNKRALAWIILLIGILTLAGVFSLRSENEGGRVLVFNNSSLEQIVKTLEKEYDAHIVIADKKINKCTFTGFFYQTGNLNDILQTLDQALNLKHKFVSEGNYLLMGSGCQGI